MQKITSDAEFKAALASLSEAKQRQVAKRFIEHVIELTDSPRVRKSMAFIDDNAPAPHGEIADGHKVARAAAIESYTLCGNEGDWRIQAGHFVAAAAVACLTPGPQAERDGNLAWNAAMNARMARVCERIAEGEDADSDEAMAQHQILASFLKTG